MKGCWECCYLVSTSPLSRPAFPVSLEHIYSAIDTPWNLSCILVIHWHQSLSTLNNIYKYTGDLLCAGWPVPGSPEALVRARDTQSSDKVCYWQHLEKCKQTIRGRQRDGAPEGGPGSAASLWSQHLQMGLLWHLSLSLTGILSAPIKA